MIVFIMFPFLFYLQLSQEYVDMNSTPKMFISQILNKLGSLWQLSDSEPSNYMLKVKGYEEYLYGDYSLLHFQVNIFAFLHFLIYK